MMHGANTPNEDMSQNIPKSGGIKNALTTLTNIGSRMTFKAGRNTSLLYKTPRESSLTTRYMKLHHQTRDHGT